MHTFFRYVLRSGKRKNHFTTIGNRLHDEVFLPNHTRVFILLYYKNFLFNVTGKTRICWFSICKPKYEAINYEFVVTRFIHNTKTKVCIKDSSFALAEELCHIFM